ncbi:MAG: hypothetical protein IKP24_02070 [Alphaproteobacteria bacterium]|nr:hypothetical protein [Alphaproteobacteria bacterium]
MSKHLLLKTLGLAAAMMVAGCEKDPVEPDHNNPSNPSNPQPQPKHNVELVYGKLPSTQWQHIDIDTIQKYNSDPTVDTIFMIPEMYNQYSTFSTAQLQTLVTKLRPRHNVNPDKVFGKGELQLWNQSVLNNPEIVRFFADTLKYDVTYYNTTKSR